MTRPDYFTNTPEDAARYEDMRGMADDPDPRPTRPMPHMPRPAPHVCRRGVACPPGCEAEPIEEQP